MQEIARRLNTKKSFLRLELLQTTELNFSNFFHFSGGGHNSGFNGGGGHGGGGHNGGGHGGGGHGGGGHGRGY